ncbi:MAG TPA: dolichyl-phosphate beta-glucosyltransferase [Tepidisphaeraceae bacterium]|nr:dolichyl-phosphate beta-glucosyltransferase [Tepidisphaeraceae bacterium]
MSNICRPYLSLIIPAYNESATILDTLSAVRGYLCGQPWQWEVIVCADGADGTRERARDFSSGDSRFQVIGSPARRGKGRGVREGVLGASGDVIGFLDADYKTPVEELEKLLPWLAGGFDVAIGSRRATGARVEVAPTLCRRAGSRVFGAMMRQLMGLPDVRDTQCGFKFFTRPAATTLFSLQQVDGYMFDIEILRLCGLLDLRVKEVGVRWRDDGDSRYDPIFGTWKNMRELLRIRKMKYKLSSVASCSI